MKTEKTLNQLYLTATRRVDATSPPSPTSLRAPHGADLLSHCTHIPPGCRDTKKTFPQQEQGEDGGGGGGGGVEN